MSQSSAAGDNKAVAEVLRKNPEVVHLAVLAAENRNSKLISLGLSLLQRLASFNAMSSDQFTSVAKVLRTNAEVRVRSFSLFRFACGSNIHNRAQPSSHPSKM